MTKARASGAASLLCVLALLGGTACSVDESVSPLENTASASTVATSTEASASSGTGGSGGAIASTSAGTGGFVAAAHTPFPDVSAHENKILANVELVTITFAGDPHIPDADAFGAFVGTSKWLTTVGAEYGVGAGTDLAKVVLSDTPPSSDANAQMLIADRIADGTLPSPGAPNVDVLYMLYMPSSATFDDPTLGGDFCDDYVGYHGNTIINGNAIVYALVGDCNEAAADITSTAAHEYIEAATDPSNEGYFLDPAMGHDPWQTMWGTEIADFCQDLPNVSEAGIGLQRIWSVAASKAGLASPCLPVPDGEPYYNVTASPASMPNIAAGESATFTLTGWSPKPVPAWGLSVDLTMSASFAPDTTFSSKKISNGETVTITLTVPKGTPKGQVGGVLVYSGENEGQYWPIGVISK